MRVCHRAVHCAVRGVNIVGPVKRVWSALLFLGREDEADWSVDAVFRYCTSGVVCLWIGVCMLLRVCEGTACGLGGTALRVERCWCV